MASQKRNRPAKRNVSEKRRKKNRLKKNNQRGESIGMAAMAASAWRRNVGVAWHENGVKWLAKSASMA